MNLPNYNAYQIDASFYFRSENVEAQKAPSLANVMHFIVEFCRFWRDVGAVTADTTTVQHEY